MASRLLSLWLTLCLCPQFVLLGAPNVDVNTACVPNPCTNGGVCALNGTSFACQCPQGFQGSRCEIRPGQCITNPCINGICQLDSNGIPQCFCTPGFVGRNCEINENECASSPCRNGGLCVDQVNSFRCSCKAGTYGLRCELQEKDLQKCVQGCDGGLCWRNESRVIKVEWGYVHGNESLCNTQHSCFGDQNRSLAVTPDDVFVDVQLQPQQLQLGDSLNFTMDLNMSPYVAGMRPYLTNRDEFDTCNQTNGKYLAPSPVDSLLIETDLLKEGKYFFIDNIDTTFRCEFGLRLNVSVKVNKCQQAGSATLCSSHGQCVTNFDMQAYQCKCCGGFRGEFCHKDDHCFSKPCKNGATCKNIEDDPQELYTCTCAPGYEGHDCGKVIDMCAAKPCLRDATCTPLINDFKCACPRGYTGRRCEAELNACSSNPCENSGTCVNKLDTFKCLCKAGYTGSHCEVNINECASSPCQHGTCIDQINGYKCYCKPGFGGTNCGLNLNECLSNPCYNGGFCVDEENDYRCDCGHGYRGRHCEEDLDLCKEEGWCINAVSCADQGNSVDCKCKPGYTGANCGVDVHDCANHPCLNGATCRDLVNDFQCLCKPGFSGKTCDVSAGQPKPAPDTPKYISLRLLTEDCHLLKDSVLTKDILKNITSHIASGCKCEFTSAHIQEKTMSVQCMDSITARFSVKISAITGHSANKLMCELWQHLKDHNNVLDLGHDTFIVGMFDNMTTKCKQYGYHDKNKIDISTRTQESTTNLAITIGSVCVVAGLVVAAIVVCCRCRNSRPSSLKKHQARVEDEMINHISGDLLDAIAPTPKTMYRTTVKGYHNMAFTGRFDPDDPIKSKRV